MLRIALKMLVGDRAKYVGLLLGIAFTAFLVTFAASYFCGFMTRGFALVSENSDADVWVMDPTVSSVEQTTNLMDAALWRVRSVEGVRWAVPLALGMAEVRFPNGRFQSFQVIGVDDTSLAGAPETEDGKPSVVLHAPDAVIVDEGGTEGKLETPATAADQWPHDGPHLNVKTRLLDEGDELQINDYRVKVAGRSKTFQRFPPRPLLYATISNAKRFLLPERRMLTFVLVRAVSGVSPETLAQRIERATGLKARTADDFKADTVQWYLTNSEDVGDIVSMLSIGMLVGFGVTGVMLYMFTTDNIRQYAVLKAMGASSRLLLTMVLAQAGLCGLIGTGLGLGLCSLVGEAAVAIERPFRMMWFTPLLGGITVILVSLVAAAISIRPVFKLEPAIVFAGR